MNIDLDPTSPSNIFRAAKFVSARTDVNECCNTGSKKCCHVFLIVIIGGFIPWFIHVAAIIINLNSGQGEFMMLDIDHLKFVNMTNSTACFNSDSYCLSHYNIDYCGLSNKGEWEYYNLLCGCSNREPRCNPKSKFASLILYVGCGMMLGSILLFLMIRKLRVNINTYDYLWISPMLIMLRTNGDVYNN